MVLISSLKSIGGIRPSKFGTYVIILKHVCTVFFATFYLVPLRSAFVMHALAAGIKQLNTGGHMFAFPEEDFLQEMP